MSVNKWKIEAVFKFNRNFLGKLSNKIGSALLIAATTLMLTFWKFLLIFQKCFSLFCRCRQCTANFVGYFWQCFDYNQVKIFYQVMIVICLLFTLQLLLFLELTCLTVISYFTFFFTKEDLLQVHVNCSNDILVNLQYFISHC